MSALTIPPTSPVELVAMSAGGAHFGVPVMRVRDVLDTPVIYPVPLAPAAIVGSINLRGRIVTAIDLRTRLGMPAREQGGRCMSVIVERAKEPAGEPYALLVDEVGEVLTLPPSAFDPNPVTLSKDWASVCLGLFRREKSLLLLLDVDPLLESVQTAERRAA
ncbi:MAG: chemotaxis protein CheW [Hyphomonadaceae bacterium]